MLPATDSPIDAMISELEQEAASTRRLLERIPESYLTWAPQPKSMSLGQLGLHVASIPGDLSRLASLSELDAATINFQAPSPASAAELASVLDASVSAATLYLRSLDAESLGATWRLTLRGVEVFAMRRADLLRKLMLNHWYHHRGQLTVYLRLLEVPLPVVYGRTADENPFA